MAISSDARLIMSRHLTKHIAFRVAIAISLLSGCRGRERRTPDDTLVVILDRTIRDIDPRYSLRSQDTKFSRLIAPGITTVDTSDLEPALYLAESINEIAPLQWRVLLKSGLRFSDGEPLSASDVAFTYNSVLDPATKSLSRKSFVDRFVKIVAVSDLEVDFYLRKPLATLLSDLDFGILSERAAKLVPSQFIGAGPYAVDTFDPERLVLLANPYFASLGTPAKIPRIEARTVRDGNARNLMLVGGSADFCQNGVRGDLVEQTESRKRVQVVSGESAILTYLMFHNEDPLLSDRRVRQAIALAVDRERIIDAKFGGRAVLATGLLPPFHWAYFGGVPRYDFDKKRAMRLLDEAGYPDPDGPGGKPRFTISFKTSASQFRLSLARVIASQLGEIGIDVDVHSYEFGTFFADIKSGNYQMATMQTGNVGEPDYYYAYYHSSRIPDSESPHLQNRWRFRNARIDELTELGRSSMDREKRKEYYREVQIILATELPVIPLWHEDNIAVMNTTIKGYTLLPSSRFAGFANASK
ncbi:MAG: ABC transporter substrate-binding protein [Kofleriaceae bacterium]|nr:ABC transporter substrate-binding protein [Kofleriaceae bacterium]